MSETTSLEHTDAFVASIPYLSFQQRRMLREQALDLRLWRMGFDIEDLWKEEYCADNVPKAGEKNTVRQTFSRVMKRMEELRKQPVDYGTFKPDYDFTGRKTRIITDFRSPETIMGRCPCPRDGEQTRCCNLKTLDAVQQCAFACAYCSIQSFYSENEVRVLSDLKEHLENMQLEEGTWHIGTGQSSDSLLLGDDYGTLSALKSFAEKHPDTIIELKTKSARTDWISDDIPANMIFTWSLNAATPAASEEHLAASPKARIRAAELCAKQGHLVGFHIHPMIFFDGWEKEYKELVMALCDSMAPENVALVGIGTLTFTKQNLKTLRESGRPTRVTQMPLSPVAGKFSYDTETKRRLFSYLYSCFPDNWKEKVFFYLCMEEPSLWKSCLGREYSCNADFEADMKKHYFEKVNLLRETLQQSHS